MEGIAQRPNGEVSAEVRSADGAGRSVSSERPGGRALSVLAVPLNLQVLQALSERPMRLAELRKATGLPAQTTLRGHLASLADIGVLTKRPTERMPYAVENALTTMGEEMAFVAERLEVWLRDAPEGPIPLESGAAKGAVKALAEAWSSSMMGALAIRPMSLTELDSEIPQLSYPALERRLSSMRIAGLVAAQPSEGSGTPYAVTDWARRGVAPLVAASRCERVHMGPKGRPLAAGDVEATFLLAAPLIQLPDALAGSCQLEVKPSRGLVLRPIGIQMTVDQGRVVASARGEAADAFAKVSGSVADWLEAIKSGELSCLRFEGSVGFGEEVAGGLHRALVSGDGAGA